MRALRLLYARHREARPRERSCVVERCREAGRPDATRRIGRTCWAAHRRNYLAIMASAIRRYRSPRVPDTANGESPLPVEYKDQAGRRLDALPGPLSDRYTEDSLCVCSFPDSSRGVKCVTYSPVQVDVASS
jgi:hypothetical protein